MDATRAKTIGLAMIATAVAASASAQTHVGKTLDGGLYWSVRAPKGASWSLTCRFQPVTYYENAYDDEHWINRLERTGQGHARGRLPIDAGYCHLTKTGGAGPVAVALARPGATAADATRDRARRAAVGLM
jgi:hypothetical protein